MNQAVNVRTLDRVRPWREGLDDGALDTLFREARTHNGWRESPVPRHLLEQAVDLAKMGPTAANSSPLRVLFVESPEAKARLKPALAPGNVEKTSPQATSKRR